MRRSRIVAIIAVAFAAGMWCATEMIAAGLRERAVDATLLADAHNDWLNEFRTT